MAPSLTCPVSGVLRHHQHPQRALALQDVHPRDQAPLRTLSQQGKTFAAVKKYVQQAHPVSRLENIYSS